jgi:hypothetical protein
MSDIHDATMLSEKLNSGVSFSPALALPKVCYNIQIHRWKAGNTFAPWRTNVGHPSYAAGEDANGMDQMNVGAGFEGWRNESKNLERFP